MLVIIRKYFLAIFLFFFALVALVEVEKRIKSRSRSRSNRTTLSSVLASSFVISVLNLLVHRSISILLYLYNHCMRRVIVDKIIPCRAFSITSREHVRSKVLRNVVMHLWNSEADVMLKTLTTTCMSFSFFFLRMFPNSFYCF